MGVPAVTPVLLIYKRKTVLSVLQVITCEFTRVQDGGGGGGGGSGQATSPARSESRRLAWG